MKLKYIVKIFVITYLIFGITNTFAENKIVYIDMNKVLNDSKVGAFVENGLTKLHEKKLKNVTILTPIFLKERLILL